MTLHLPGRLRRTVSGPPAIDGTVRQLGVARSPGGRPSLASRGEAAGMGCTVLPESAKRVAPSTVAFMEIPDLDVAQHWQLVWRTDNRSALLKRFIEVVAGYVASQAGS